MSVEDLVEMPIGQLEMLIRGILRMAIHDV